VTKIIRTKYKISRRLGCNLWGRAKDPVNKRNFVPGQHGRLGVRRSTSDYATQLRAKQKLKGYYGTISEKQFARIFKEASRLKGDTGENLVGLLERRLDTFVYRMNLAATVFAARQLVSHKHVKVNGKKVNIGSYILKIGDVVELTDKTKENVNVMESVKRMERDVPDYIEFDAKAFRGKLIRVPSFAEIPYPVPMEPNLVIEYYSR
jgi:small subunit ribosomal protein S4